MYNQRQITVFANISGHCVLTSVTRATLVADFFPLIPSCVLVIDLSLNAVRGTYRWDARPLNWLNGRRHYWADSGRTDWWDIQRARTNRPNLSVYANTPASCISFVCCQDGQECQSEGRQDFHVFLLVHNDQKIWVRAQYPPILATIPP